MRTTGPVIVEGEVDATAPSPFGLHFVRVPYDIERELAEARALGNPDQAAYEIELRRAMYRGTAQRLGLLE